MLQDARAVSYVDGYSHGNDSSLQDKLLVKLDQWKQESEWRMVIDDRQQDYIEIPSAAIVEVTFGAACTEESEIFVLEKLERLGLSPKVFRCKVADSEPRLERVVVE